MDSAALHPAQRRLAFALLVAASIVSVAATDLVLPAVPGLPQALHGTPAQAQQVLAGFIGGFGVGLLAFGELGARHDQRKLLAGSLVAFALLSLVAGLAGTLPELIALRVAQGAAAAAGAAFAPGVIRQVFAPQQALRAIGLQGSLESLMPAFAPIAGAALLALGSWRLSFLVLAATRLLLAASIWLLPREAFPPVGQGRSGSYLQLLRNRAVARHGWSYALSLAGLLVVVFGAPAVLVNVWGAPLSHFVRMQVVGVACFIAAVQLSAPLCRRWGEETVVLHGTLLSALGCAAILAHALAGGRNTPVLLGLWVVVNLGFGLRGPPGFLGAIAAAGGDDSRAAALVILAMLGTAALGTAVVAPWITAGLVPVALASTLLSAASLPVLWLLRPRAPG